MAYNDSPYPEINFMIGSACNWHCSYCLQGHERGFDKPVDVDAFIEKFRKYLEDNHIEKVTRIQYWGGEPLLYLDTIKKLKAGFADIPRYQSRDRIVTNGSLVDDDFVDFVQNNNIYVNVSYHDGQLPEEQWEKILHIEDLTLTGLLHHKRLTLDEFHDKWQYIWDTYGRCTTWCIAPIYNTEGVPKDFYITKDDVDKMVEYHKSVITPKAATDVFFKNYLNVFAMLLTEHGDIPAEDNACYNKKAISVDLRGNSYFCHHDCSASSIAGNLFDPLSIHKTLPRQADQCYTCSLQRLCHGGCVRDQTHDIVCYMFKRWYEFLMWLQDCHPEYVDDRYWKELNGEV